MELLQLQFYYSILSVLVQGEVEKQRSPLVGHL